MRLPIDRGTVSTILFAVIALAALPTTFAAGTLQGDPARGERIYNRCQGCHSIDRDRIGPRHAGLIGRRAGTVPGFNYSAAMRKAGAAGLVWNETTLNKFLENPTKFVPGTRMVYAGIKDPPERADLIAYLEKAAGHAPGSAKAGGDSGIAGTSKE